MSGSRLTGSRLTFCFALLVGAALAACAADDVGAAHVAVHGGPTFTSSAGGYLAFPQGSPVAVNDRGEAVAYARRFEAGGRPLGTRAVRWDGTGGAAVELTAAGTDPNGVTETVALDINASGSIIGRVRTFHAAGQRDADRAARWDAPAAAPLLMDRLAQPGGSFDSSHAWQLNDAGTAVGYSARWSFPGGYDGLRPVRWDASSGALTELDVLGTDSSGATSGDARAINAAGVAAGYVEKFTGGQHRGARAVRWSATGTAVTELGTIDTDPAGNARSGANAINLAGTAVGSGYKYNDAGLELGTRAVRWDGSGTAATELGHLGTNSAGYALCNAVDINDEGITVGFAQAYDANGANLGLRATRWDPGSTAAVELPHVLEPTGDAAVSSEAFAINASGLIVGYDRLYAGGHVVVSRAVVWTADGGALDLNDLIDPASGWTLNVARAISDTGWVAGTGTFDPDGAGGEAPYPRLFLLQVPEPSSLALPVLVAPLVVRRRRPRQHRTTG